ncbi:MAG: hypothetical protein HFI93_11165 [Lachnospiraceae bacterium]|nr:hypothetical protein [Lachnospiraceae bacterium]
MKSILRKFALFTNFTAILLIISLLMLSGCTKNNPEASVIKYEMEVEALSWEEIVKNSTCAVEATYEEYIPHEEYVEYKFRVEHVEYGNIEDTVA